MSNRFLPLSEDELDEDKEIDQVEVKSTHQAPQSVLVVDAPVTSAQSGVIVDSGDIVNTLSTDICSNVEEEEKEAKEIEIPSSLPETNIAQPDIEVTPDTKTSEVPSTQLPAEEVVDAPQCTELIPTEEEEKKEVVNEPDPPPQFRVKHCGYQHICLTCSAILAYWDYSYSRSKSVQCHICSRSKIQFFWAHPSNTSRKQCLFSDAYICYDCLGKCSID